MRSVQELFLSSAKDGWPEDDGVFTMGGIGECRY